MLKIENAHEYVRSIVFTSFDRLRSQCYYQDEIYIVLLALYAYKTHAVDDIKRELLDTTIHRLEEDSEAFVEIYEQLKKVNHDEYMKVYPFVVDEIVEYAFINHGKMPSNHVLPKKLVTLLCELIKKTSCTTVYNPFAGIGSIVLSLGRKHCYSQEINKRAHAIGMVLLDAHGYDTTTYSLSEAFDEWNPSHSECVVSFPPFGTPILSGKDEKIPIRNIEEFVFWQFSRSAENYAIYVVPNGFCFNSNNSTLKLRKELTESNYLDMVVALPAGIYSNMGIATSIIVLKKERVNGEPVKFLDAHEMYISKNKRERELDIDAILGLIENHSDNYCSIVGLDKIRENDYRWDVGSYMFRKFEVFPEGYKVLELDDIVESIPLNRHFSDTEGPLVKIAQMSNDIENYNRTPDSFERSSDIQRCSKLDEPALLISTIGALKPIFCSASVENPVFLHTHVRAFRIRPQWVNPAYLCLQLSKSKSYTVGAFVPHITVRDILRIRIAFPSLESQQSFEEQGRLYNESIESNKLAKAKEMGLQEVIDKMKAEYINVIRTRKHDMRPYVRELDSAELLMRHYLSKKDEMTDFDDKMNVILDQYHIALSKLSELIDVFSEEDSFGEPEPFNLNKYLVDLETNHAEITGYWVEYDRDDNTLVEYGIPVPCGGSYLDENLVPIDANSDFHKDLVETDSNFPLIVEINHLDFERLVKNIIENAVAHGFTDPNRTDYGIGIDLTVDMEKGMFQIDFSNNGTPLPSGMDKERYGILGEKAGLTGRTGRGGYIVKSIVEHYHGDYDVFMDEKNTVVRILLPISKDNFDYEQYV